MNSKLGRCLLLVGVGLALWAVVAKQEKVRVEDRTRSRAVAMFDSIPVLAESVVEAERITGNWKLRTASVDRLVVSRDSIEEVCAFYASKLRNARWSGGISPLRCEPLEDGLYRLSGHFPAGDETYTFQLFVQSMDRVSWGGVWVGGDNGFEHFHRAMGSGYPTLLMLRLWFAEDVELRDSPCRSWEDWSCEDGEWESNR